MQKYTLFSYHPKTTPYNNLHNPDIPDISGMLHDFLKHIQQY